MSLTKNRAQLCEMCDIVELTMSRNPLRKKQVSGEIGGIEQDIYFKDIPLPSNSVLIYIVFTTS